ncbi:MAG: ABC transporter transmembrane domain-containing protein [Parvibaculaceae bacterium]
MSQPSSSRPRGKSLKPLARLLPLLSRYRGHIAAALIALIAAAGATLSVPVAVRRVIDHGFSGSDTAIVNQYFAVMLAVVGVLAIASGVRFYLVTWLGERVVADLRDKVFAHLLDLSPAFYERERTGEVVSRLTADTTQIKAAFSTSASILLRNLVMLIGAVVMMTVTSLKLSGLVLIAIPLIMLPLILFGRKVRSLSRDAQDTLADSAAFAQERLSAVTAVQSFVQENATFANFAAATQKAFDAAARRTLARGFLTTAIIFLSLGSVTMVLWYGAREVIAGTMTAGSLSQFVLFAVLAASSLGELSQVWGEIQSAAGASERIAEILDEKPEITAPATPIMLPAPKGEVAFDGVSFHYASRSEGPALEDLSFTVAPGETVALVGPSGAGKTTVFALIQRFYDPQQGRVLIDGIDIRTADPRAIRTRIAVVPQDTVIFSGTVLDNIRFGCPETSKAELLSAAQAARVNEFVERMPQGYDTEVGERGITLSGGQRQRIAIARAILRDAPILLLDEATSALDAESEALIQEALERLTRGRTTLVIAHRLATVRNAGRILVLDQGRLVAQGRHGELTKSSPLYSRLAELQFNVKTA